MTLLDLLDAARCERAESPAVNGETYAALHAASLRVAAHLHEFGLRAGDRLALYCENRMAFVYAYLAALRMGAVVVPVNVLYRASELEHVLNDAAVSLVLTSEGTHAHVAATGSYATIDAADVEATARASGEVHRPAGNPPGADDDAAIIYTSGTTGRSKGAVLTHTNVAAIASQVAVAWRWTARDTLYVALPLFHMHGLGAALNGTFAAGAHLRFDERFHARRALDVLRGGEITMFFGVPTMYVRLLEALDGAAPRLRLWVSGSARWRRTCSPNSNDVSARKSSSVTARPNSASPAPTASAAHACPEASASRRRERASASSRRATMQRRSLPATSANFW